MPPGDVSFHLEELLARVDELERRIAALERAGQTRSPYLESPPAMATVVRGSNKTLPATPQPSMLSVFGRAVLGVAGAYLLRAASESGIFPARIALTVALAYAAGWLVWAAWPGAQAQFTRLCYAITAALILSPVLWESTVRFKILEPPVTSAVLAAFALLAIILAWHFNVSAVVWVGMLASVFTALVLFVGARAPVPFTLALLFMASLIEFAACHGRWRVLRTVVAMAADFATLILIIILGDAAAVPPEYHPVSANFMIALVAALWAVYAISLAVSSLILQLKIKTFEVAQFAVTVLLAAWGVLRVTRGAGLFAIGTTCLVLGAACYFVAFGLLARHRERPNFRFYAVCGITFVMVGSFLALPTLAQVIWLCLAALIATGLGVRMRSPALDVHGVVYLSGALLASGLLVYAGRALAGTFPPAPGALPSVTAAVALLCTAMVSRYPGEHSVERVLRLLPAILGVYATAGLAVAGLAWLTARGGAPTLPSLALIRTIVTCAAALLLAFVGARRKRLELVWMAYAAAVLSFLKLAMEDLRFGNTQTLAVSLFIYGAVLILIPRLVRAGSRPA